MCSTTWKAVALAVAALVVVGVAGGCAELGLGPTPTSTPIPPTPTPTPIPPTPTPACGLECTGSYVMGPSLDIRITEKLILV